MDSHLRGIVENISSVSNVGNSFILVENVETLAFLSKRIHSSIILRFWMNILCVSHKNIDLKKRSLTIFNIA